MTKQISLLGLLIGLYLSTNALSVNSTFIEQGMQAPVFNIKQLNGSVFKLEPNNITIIWFFTPWCEMATGRVYPYMAEDCQNAATYLKQAYQRHASQFSWIGISSKLAVTSKEVNSYRAKHGIPFAIAIDNPQEIFSLYGVTYSPTVIIVNKNTVIYRAKADLKMFEETLIKLSSQD